ncbi:MAG: hypothetical protein Q7W51_02975 [Coriobacteriia bacterium]|nr:hypothetical protein [Coriobacteriia bacterium]
MKSIKVRIILLVVIVNMLGGAVIMAGMNAAYNKNVELVKQASSETIDQEAVQEQLFADMAGNRNRALVMVAVLALVMSAGLLVVLDGLLFKRLKKIVHDTMSVIGGKFDAPIVVVRDDEMGELEKTMEQFRLLFIEAVNK